MSPRGRPRLRPIKRLVALLTFIAGFAFAGWLGGSYWAEPNVPILSAKLAHLAVHGADYDTLFVGSSRLYHQIDPQLFDALMRTRGVPTRSFNLGADDLHSPEDSFVLERALANRTAPLRWVFLEAASLRLKMDADFRATVRARYWHDTTRLELIGQRYLQGNGRYGKQGWRRRGELLSEFPFLLQHLQAWGGRALGHGNGALAWRRLGGIGVDERDETDALGPAGDGFSPEPPGALPERLLANYQRGLADRQRRPARATFSDPVSQQIVQRLQQLVARQGGELILIVPPSLSDKFFAPDPAAGPAPRVFNFSNPREFPQLFDPAFRHDIDHLNPQGAAELTRRLAGALGS